VSELLRIEGLTARYGQITALADVSLAIGAGEAVALLGANGAGKATLMKTIMGLVAPAAGTLAFEGRDLARTSTADRARLGLGYSPEGRRVFAGMTVRENLEVACRAGASETARRRDEVFALFPALAEKRDVLGWQLSGGQQQMLAIGRALMTAPKLLLLDEPSLGLSPILTNEVLARVKAIRGRGTAVLLAEQNVAKALQVADRAYVLQVGRIHAEGPAAELATDPRIRHAFLGPDARSAPSRVLPDSQ
jgi:branched-chain amino acid transport system ATP-binding protein